MIGATQVRSDDDCADSEVWSDSRYILKEQSAGFSEKLDIGCERKRKV